MQASTQYTAANGLFQRLSLLHGYLNKKGYCNGNDCQVQQLVRVSGNYQFLENCFEKQAWIAYGLWSSILSTS